MTNYRTFAIYDFESTSLNPEEADPVQLSCVMINPRTLEIIPDSYFNSYMKPDMKRASEDTIKFHLTLPLSKEKGWNRQDLIDFWQSQPNQKDVFEQFIQYTKKYHMKGKNKNKFTSPCLGGQNIIHFDNLILQRLARKYKYIDKQNNQNIFWTRDQLDLITLAFYWFENRSDAPKSFSQENLLDYFGMSKEGLHDSLQDIKNCARLIIRFLKLARSVSQKIQFKGALANE